MKSEPRAPASLAESDYVRERTAPRPGDPFYPHLSDLLAGLLPCLPGAGACVLDYGCGGSPYRGLFKSPACYHRADFPGLPALDFICAQDSRIAAPGASYDFVLSTQVFEHVARPAVYLSECLRVLRPGGRLLLTTHGLYPDHACPYDFRRWTAEGLKMDIADAGFEIEKIEKLTSGPRALAFMNRLNQSSMFAPFFSIPGLAVRLGRIAYSRIPPAWLDRLCDSAYSRHRVVPIAEPGHEFYIALLALARRPA